MICKEIQCRLSHEEPACPRNHHASLMSTIPQPPEISPTEREPCIANITVRTIVRMLSGLFFVHHRALPHNSIINGKKCPVQTLNAQGKHHM